MSIWDNAFKINRDIELKEEEKVILLKAVKKIKEKKLEDIAILIAESTRPVHNITANFLYFLQPTLGFIFSKQDLETISRILENPKGLEFFKEKLNEEGK